MIVIILINIHIHSHTHSVCNRLFGNILMSIRATIRILRVIDMCIRRITRAHQIMSLHANLSCTCAP